MVLKNSFFAILAFVLCMGCKPRPIDIDVPQQQAKLVVSASCINASTVLVAVGYSVNSLRNLDDTALQSGKVTPGDLLSPAALVYITAKGQLPDTLTQQRPGVYGKKHLNLQPYLEYTLTVIDGQKNVAATATTMYMPGVDIDTIYPEITKYTADTAIRLKVSIKNNRPHEHFFISYSTRRQVREIMNDPHPALNSYTPKKIELIEDEGSGNIMRTITLQNTMLNDTLLVHVGHIDEQYYKYLMAYKRTGYLLNQITAEPINLPTNLSSGYGYFALYQPLMKYFDLKRY